MPKGNGLDRFGRSNGSFNQTLSGGYDPQGFRRSRPEDRITSATKTDDDAGGAAPLMDSISAYFASIRKIPLLDKQKEKSLSRLIASGDMRAREAMIVANLRLVVSIARRFQGRGVPLQDLIEEGNVSLIKAVEKFKASKGCRFSTYATYWIRQALDRSVSNQSSTIRLPIHIRTNLKKVANATRAKDNSGSTGFNEDEISRRTGLDKDYIAWLETLNVSTCPIDIKSGSSEDRYESLSIERLADLMACEPHELIERRADLEELKDGLGRLDSSERTILERRFGLAGINPETLESIGGDMGVTRERVRQIEKRALAKLKTMLVHKV